MSLSIPVVWSELHSGHVPGGEVWVGVRTPGTEVPARAERIRAELEAAGAPVRDAEAFPDEEALALHDEALVDWLRTAWERWREAGLEDDPGQDRVVPYLFPHPELLGGLPLREPAATTARAGRFAFDTMTLIGPGTWEAARGAIDAALTAAEIAAGGGGAAYALCRPPGHHATRSAIGGSCYLGNSAAAASRLRDRLGGPVAVIDVDAHHGNGTQSLFYADRGVLTGSVHIDPAAGWFPHFVGFAEERGAGDADGANRNIPLPPGTGDDPWIAAVDELATWALANGACGLVVALGVDAAAADPESPFEVSAEGYGRAGRILGSLRLPTVIVQEGGYDLETIGPLVRATLEGFEAGAA
jgi:acetoin utilization deacetylase AcuC-like enzyme